jgi:hypothetical protein
MRVLKCTILFLSLLAGAGCDSSSSSSDDSDSEISTTGPLAERSFVSECGTVVQRLLLDSVSIENGESVSFVRVVSSNSVIVRAANGDLLVKLHGLSDAGSRGVSVLESLATPEMLFVPAGDGCNATNEGGGVATIGQLFTTNGINLSEELIKSGASGQIESAGACSEELLSPCYSALREANAPRSAGEITDFLWKPRAESDFNKGSPVIHANPCDATVVVNGESLMDFGPANGRCNTSRMFRACGTYGQNIKVEIFDNATGLPYFNGSEPFVTVPDGCSRFEFKR